MLDYRSLLPVLATIFVLSTTVWAQENSFVEARKAFINRDVKKLDTLYEGVKTHPLAYIIEHWRLRLNIKKETKKNIDRFLSQHSDDYFGERLRRDWLKKLGKDGDWEAFDEYIKVPIRDNDTVLSCFIEERRYYKSAKNRQKALDNISEIWQASYRHYESCSNAFKLLNASGRLTEQQILERLMRQLEMKRLSSVKATITYLPVSLQPNKKDIQQALAKPLSTIDELSTQSTLSVEKQLLFTIALQRYCRSKPRETAALLDTYQKLLRNDLRLWLWTQVGRSAARDQLPEAIDWYTRGRGGYLTESGHEWWVRAALRVKSWPNVLTAIQAMSEALVGKPVWTYWYGVALDKGKKQKKARRQWQKLDDGLDYYSTLARTELGKKVLYDQSHAIGEIPQEDRKILDENPLIQASLKIKEVGLVYEATKNWNFAVLDWSDERKIFSAIYAHEKDFWGRMIGTAKRAKKIKNHALLFPLPYLKEIQKQALEVDLPLPLIYGLIRQESHFDSEARSFAGAVGLMQLMPKTADWIAKRAFIEDYRRSRTSDVVLNVRLGTEYLLYLFKVLEDHPVMVVAGYNAGPGRSRRWQSSGQLQAAIYIETIPFDETREYVQAVLNNATWYASRIRRKSADIHQWLPHVPARVK